MHSCESESRELGVVKPHALPVVNRVALFARRRESCGYMIRRRGLLVCSLMARVALNRQPLELPDSSTLVAICAVQSRVTAHQREAIVVFPGSLRNDAPPFHRVTLLAARAHLSAMNVCMTIGAACPHVREDRFGVALCTRNTLMQAAQRILGCIVVEFWNCPNGLPPHRGVAVLARNAQAAVRATRYGLAGLTVSARHQGARRQPHADGDQTHFRK